jgi:hypothetical protein
MTSILSVWRSADMKLPYFKLKDAFEAVKNDFSFGSGADKLASVSKLLGKTVANVGLLAVEAGIEAVKRAPEIAGSLAKSKLEERRHLMTSEEIEKHEEIIRRGDEAYRQRTDSE